MNQQSYEIYIYIDIYIYFFTLQYCIGFAIGAASFRASDASFSLNMCFLGGLTCCGPGARAEGGL